jgi:hypothetical protein
VTAPTAAKFFHRRRLSRAYRSTVISNLHIPLDDATYLCGWTVPENAGHSGFEMMPVMSSARG